MEALIPEVSVARDFGVQSGRWPLVSVRYRFYRQSGARFHADHYDAVEPQMSGDPRWGPRSITRQGWIVRWPLFDRPDGLRGVTLDAGYAVTVLDYKADHTAGSSATSPLWRSGGAF